MVLFPQAVGYGHLITYVDLWELALTQSVEEFCCKTENLCFTLKHVSFFFFCLFALVVKFCKSLLISGIQVDNFDLLVHSNGLVNLANL